MGRVGLWCLTSFSKIFQLYRSWMVRLSNHDLTDVPQD